ncbi:MAG: DNA mismatch repair protein MutS [Eubacteriales bacterium]|nr:DNA mismatch repair protein MutS [Eubacteriales bacterium]
MADDKLLTYDQIDRAALTPMMEQYLTLKEGRPDAYLFFRLGDFYELFFDDALEVSKLLGLALTGRDCGLPERAPMCGIPYHAAESYIARLLEGGHKVAIAEQVEDPKEATGLVERQIIRVISPGTIIDPDQLDALSYSYIACVYQQDSYYGLAYADISASRFAACKLIFGRTSQKLLDELSRIKPQEIVANQDFFQAEVCQQYKDRKAVSLTCLEPEAFSLEARQKFGMNPGGEADLATIALTGLLTYLADQAFVLPDPLPEPEIYELEAYMVLDRTARQHLEITETLRTRERKGSLLWALDNCETSMGSRLLQAFISQPLLNLEEINWRQACIQAFYDNFVLRSELRKVLAGVYDLERLAGRLALASANPRDVYAVGRIQAKIPDLQNLLGSLADPNLQALANKLAPLTEISQEILSKLEEELPLRLSEGGIFRPGADPQLDKLREAAQHGSDWLLDFEQAERQRTGIKNLKLKYNRVFGYTIDISKTNLDKVPDDYIRRQTLANSERFYTPELKAMEERILGAEQKILILEQELFIDLRKRLSEYLPDLQQNAQVLALLDVFAGQADLASKQGYCRPHLVDVPLWDVQAGRHPVVEKILKKGEFVANDLYLDQGDKQLMIITGPNMAGKSTYMRQFALLVIMAQAGLFVPAQAATLGLVDRVFTRVGASDDLASGQSTFMIEMNEVSQILREASPRSLLILDEIGRGTSTWDGLSIAWSVIEHVANPDYLGCPCLFATHYHELTELAESLAGVFNAHVDIVRQQDQLEFLHQIKLGASDHSYGIEVAKLANIPDEVIRRAREILHMLEEENQGQRLKIRKAAQPMEGQIDLFSAAQAWQGGEELRDALLSIDINMLRPLDALAKLADLQDLARKLKGKIQA